MRQPLPPPSPPPSSDGFLQQSTTVMNSSGSTSHPRGTMSPEQGFVGYSYPSRYSTPVREDDIPSYEPSTVYSQRSDVSFTGYAGMPDITSHPYGPLPDEIGYHANAPYTPEASPPTPCPTSDSITTRSGLSVSKKLIMGKSPGVKSGRVQKRARAEKAKSTSSILTKPLSEIAKDLPDVPVADIATFVARSTEERLSETSRNKKAGQIKRPMNAFMLYRKAYQEVAKTQCAQNNHQHVSKVCGAGWPLEPPLVKQMFDEWAKIERMNHQHAHPGYKFTPSKPRKARRDEDGDDYNGVSDNDDSDWNGGRGLSGGARKSRFRQVSRRSETPSMTYETVGGAMDEPPMAAYHGMYAYPTPGRTHVLPYGLPEPSPYDMSMRQYHGLGIGQGMASRTPSPALDYSLHGVDGFVNSYYTPPEPVYDNAAIPSMFGDVNYAMCDGISGETSFGSDGWIPHMGAGQELAPMLASYEDTTAQDAYLKGKQEDWKVEEMDEPGEFEYWITQTEQGLI
ncbi:mating type 1-2 [Fusarium albosuccineum]|uniref:Mating type 1-2 n=1 Tax=Fusarium albosuccineum TaxID=1237068 RepID=A0A8H4L7A7_9HYPO|nr:mating type 1-2 [Fusarium albosuccineum]